jgi:hypothetical protein
LLATRILIDQIKDSEYRLERKINEIEFIKNRSLCTNIVFSAVAFLEASINELFMDSDDNKDRLLLDLTSEEIGKLNSFWKLGIPRTAQYSIIDKYRIAISILGKQQIDLGSEPYQSISCLIKLRNSLVHYEPEWVVTKTDNDEEMTNQKIDKLLVGKYTLNKWTGDDNPFFPDKCLSFGMALWILKILYSFRIFSI